MPASEYILRLREKVGHELIMMPSAAAIIRNEKNEILLHQLRNTGQWSLPGGAIDPGESAAEAVVREVFEETGLNVRPVSLVGIYSGGSHHFITYPNGDQIGVVNMAFNCEVIGGELNIDNDVESIALKYFAYDSLPDNVLTHHLQRIEHAYTRTEPYIGVD